MGNYLMDGLVVLCEYDGGLNILREYVPGVSIKQNGNTYYYIYDRLGNVRYVLDETGAIVNSYIYTPFGQIHTETENLSQPYQFVGGEFYYTEDTTGLQLLGQRWYDGQTGRFISRDPIGEEGGLNLYVYVGNNCVNKTDRRGLRSACDCQDECDPGFNKCQKKCLLFKDSIERSACLLCCDRVWHLCYKECNNNPQFKPLDSMYSGCWKRIKK